MQFDLLISIEARLRRCGKEAIRPPLNFCTDNAVMIANAALEGIFSETIYPEYEDVLQEWSLSDLKLSL